MACDISHIGTVDARQVVIAKFFSSTESVSPQTANYHSLGTSDSAYITELNLLGQATTTIGTQTSQYNFGTGSPYPTRLRPVSNLERLYKNTCVRLVSIEFNAIDTTYPGAEGQDATVVQQIIDTIDPNAGGYSPGRAYMQTRFRNGAIGGWQPNWFRPQVVINGQDVLFEPFGRTNWSRSPGLGDRGIGLLLPYCLKLDMRFGSIDDKGINVFGACYQYVDTGGEAPFYQRYAIDAELIFIIEDDKPVKC